MTIYKSSALLIPSRRTFLTLMKAPALGLMVVGLILGMFSWVANPAQLALAQGINGLITHTTVTDFNAACTVLPGTASTPLLTQVSLNDANDGEIRLTATVEDYFEGSTINSTRWLTGTTYDWYTVPPSVSGGILTLDSAYLRSQVGFSATTPIRFFETRALQRINSNNASWPDLGFYREFPPLAYDSGPYPNDSSLRLFVTPDTNDTFIRGRDGDASAPLTDIDISIFDLTQYHNFRIEWDASESRFYVDGVLQGTIPGVSTLNTWVFLYSQDPASFDRSPMQVDWVRAGVYPSSGTYTSCIQDAGEVVNWTTLIREVDLPTDTSLVFDIPHFGKRCGLVPLDSR
ncbi:MAG: glycoside hydrolase family 16 protein [Anaerolineales bacterium]|nr:glycoside hydrolase family 16 protein [Anaerolineales bacterium]